MSYQLTPQHEDEAFLMAARVQQEKVEELLVLCRPLSGSIEDLRRVMRADRADRLLAVQKDERD